jgi:hypothetical protein
MPVKKPSNNSAVGLKAYELRDQNKTKSMPDQRPAEAVFKQIK